MSDPVVEVTMAITAVRENLELARGYSSSYREGYQAGFHEGAKRASDAAVEKLRPYSQEMGKLSSRASDLQEQLNVLKEAIQQESEGNPEGQLDLLLTPEEQIIALKAFIAQLRSSVKEMYPDTPLTSAVELLVAEVEESRERKDGAA